MLEIKVADYFDRARVAGDVGLEIELEGHNLPSRDVRGWRVEHDSSLKAAEAYEYVTNGVVRHDAVEAHLAALNAALSNHKSKVSNSYRAGVHCHINIQDLTMLQFANFITLATCFESILADQCGKDRQGNLFALRVRDAEATLDDWIESFREGRFSGLAAIKYSFMNVASAANFGSLEFRGMYSTTDPEVLLPWIRDLLALRQAAKVLEEPRQIIEAFSVSGVRGFSESVLGRKVVTRKSQEKTIREDMRFAQDFAFSRGW